MDTVATGVRLRFGGGAPGIERMEAALRGEAFSPHRHDTYAIGTTLAGVQTFRYRGRLRHCLAGQWHVLHPDETHDGAPGTDDGFGYRILYVDPALVQAALGGRPLPFVADPVVRDPLPGLAAHLARLDEPLDDLASAELVAAVADELERRADRAPADRRPPRIDLPAVTRVRVRLADDPAAAHTAADLERVAGTDRWSLARQFRAAFGTSPSRFRTQRRLDRARSLLDAGTGLAETAVLAGFADQSHLTRAFHGAYGLPPGAWRDATRSASSVATMSARPRPAADVAP
ncbi:AraC family transcriptional regulator [Cellulosimicrobium sp. NPDC057127]|uniref:AraC family transcriptional regulator n=1 Tax=Cellulosimicrobium sp. NPDC057127 TaxID=3346026 RepID=UPI00362EFA78